MGKAIGLLSPFYLRQDLQTVYNIVAPIMYNKLRKLKKA